MNSAGVTFTALARPMPAPAQAPLRQKRRRAPLAAGGCVATRPRPAVRVERRPCQRSATRSAMISAKRSRFTWPYPSVSRLGSIAPASGTASATTNQRGQPCRSAIGTSSATSTAASAARLAIRLTQPAISAENLIMGSMTSAENGG